MQQEIILNVAIPIVPTIPAVHGGVRQITITNNELFGDHSVVVHDFTETDGDDFYDSDDFSDALRFDGEMVFLNHIPSTTYQFCVGQEVQCNDGLAGYISRVLMHQVCVKIVEDDLSMFRWIRRSEYPGKLTLSFRHRYTLMEYCFVLTAGEKDSRYLSTQKKQEFSDIRKFQMSTKSLKFGKSEQICIYAKPIEGDYQWIHIKSLNLSMQSASNDVSMASGDNLNESVQSLFSWLRERVIPITDAQAVLSRFGLQRNRKSEWMKLVSSHHLLFALTAYRRAIFMERLINELDLLNTDMVLRSIEKRHDDTSMLEWLVEERKVRRLFDHYRVFTSGFKVAFRSELLNTTWMNYSQNTKLDHREEFKNAGDSCFDETEYAVNDVAYPQDKRLSFKGFPRQICRNHALFGDHDVVLDLKQYIVESVRPIVNVLNGATGNQQSWYQSVIGPNNTMPLQLLVSEHRGHSGGNHPNHLLKHGILRKYDNDRCGPVSDDWIVFQMLTLQSVPTKIVIRSRNSVYGLKSMKIFGSADNVQFEEWLHIQDIKRTLVLQHFELDVKSVHFAWSRGFKYFRLCSMQNHGGSSIDFYEFGIHGVGLYSEKHMENVGISEAFLDALSIEKDNKIVHGPSSNIDNEMEFCSSGEWIAGRVSREMKDKICVKSINIDIVSYQWIQREDMSTQIRSPIERRDEISKLCFTAIAGTDANKLCIDSKSWTFRRTERLEIPLKDVMAYSSAPDTVSIYAKPKETEFDFQLVKQIKCSRIPFSRLIVNDDVLVEQNQSGSDGTFIVIAASDINIAQSAVVRMSCDDKTSGDLQAKKGLIHLISGGNVMNAGTLLSGASNTKDCSGEMNVYINVDGEFVNQGTIDCGENGSVYIQCSEFHNDGSITPNPKVLYRNTKDNRKVIQWLSETSNVQVKLIKLRVYEHRGHYDKRPPSGLLQEGTDDKYDSDGKGPANEDWIIFRTLSKERFLPRNVVIRNYSGGYAVKTIRIDGSADGIRFDEWMTIRNIHNNNNDLQQFAVDPITGFFAWNKAYTFFKLNLLENHDGRYNLFYEFRMNGMDEE